MLAKSMYSTFLIALGSIVVFFIAGSVFTAGTSEFSVDIFPLPECSDGADNDGDALIDFPLDPGCTDASDNDEFNAVALADCSDGIDNDGDGDIDFPADSGCESSSDTSEKSGGGAVFNYINPTVQQSTIAFSGRAYTNGTVILMQDGQQIATTEADAAGFFAFGINDIPSGSYVFGVSGRDAQERTSDTLSFPASIATGSSVQVSNIFLGPTIVLDKSQVSQQSTLFVTGNTVPLADVHVYLRTTTDDNKLITVKANVAGEYEYSLPASGIALGPYQLFAIAEIAGDISSQSLARGFTVGLSDVDVIEAECGIIVSADFNKDCRVDLIDFSIASFWFREPLSGIGFDRDLNGDGIVDLVDFSIIAFYWTG